MPSIQQSHLLKMIAVEGNINNSNQNLDEIPKQLLAAQFKHITEVNLSQNYISLIPDQFFPCLPSLLHLNLSNNKLASIPPTVKKVKKLKTLNLNSNCLISLPSELGDLQYLQELEVSDNKLSVLPESVCNGCINLTRLNVSNNRIRFMPAEIDNIKGLQDLLMEKNQIVGLSCSYKKLNIKEISLDWFKYASPSMESVIYGQKAEEVWSQFKILFTYLLQNEKFECEIFDFLQHFYQQSKS